MWLLPCAKLSDLIVSTFLWTAMTPGLFMRDGPRHWQMVPNLLNCNSILTTGSTKWNLRRRMTFWLWELLVKSGHWLLLLLHCIRAASSDVVQQMVNAWPQDLQGYLRGYCTNAGWNDITMFKKVIDVRDNNLTWRMKSLVATSRGMCSLEKLRLSCGMIHMPMTLNRHQMIKLLPHQMMTMMTRTSEEPSHKRRRVISWSECQWLLVTIGIWHMPLSQMLSWVTFGIWHMPSFKGQTAIPWNGYHKIRFSTPTCQHAKSAFNHLIQ